MYNNNYYRKKREKARECIVHNVGKSRRRDLLTRVRQIAVVVRSH